VTESLQAAAVRVPCSTSNLGSGYDTIGLALDRYLDMRFEPGNEPLHLIRDGTLARLAVEEREDYGAVAFRKVLEAHGAAVTGTLHVASDIPVGRGLGSSAAAVLAGHDLARAALGEARSDESSFAAAYAHEGHGDNAASCLYGGLRAVVPSSDGPVILELDLSPEIGFAYAAPSAEVSTQLARDVLPPDVGHDLAARSLGRATALVRGLATGDPELLRIGIEDELHVPHRLPMMPGAYNAIGAGYDVGAWAVTISGAGSGLIAMCEPKLAAAVADAMHEVFSNGSDDPECVRFATVPDHEGLRRVS